MRSYDELEAEFKHNVNKLQTNCPHEEIGITNLQCVGNNIIVRRFCEFCHKEIEKKTFDTTLKEVT